MRKFLWLDLRQSSLRAALLLAGLLGLPAAVAAKADGSGKLPSSASVPASTPASGQKVVCKAAFAPFDHFYGLYVGGNKVGWMHSTYEAKPAPVLSFSLEAKVAGMGSTAVVTLREVRRYSPTTGLLEAIEFEQRSDTGAVQVHGKRRGVHMVLTTQAGGGEHVAKVIVPERLEDAMALVTLARGSAGKGAPVGAQASASHLDAATQSMVQAQMRVEAVTPLLVGGVAEVTRRISTSYPALKVKEVSSVDGHGKLLRTQVGGFFEARLEDEVVAKAAVVVQDVLLGATVKTPTKIPGVAKAVRLELSFEGLDADDEILQTPRQKAVRTAKGWLVALHKDPPWPVDAAALGAINNVKSLPPEVAEALVPTPYIQSEAPEIRAMAKAAVGDAKFPEEIARRLCAAVTSHLRAEYVPAFSNALEAYHSRRGDCTEHSVLFAALARAAGLPARPVVGIAYWPPGDGFGWHAWVEVWAGGRWRQVDPTWNEPTADVTHIKLADGGPMEQASVVMLLGKLRIASWKVPPA